MLVVAGGGQPQRRKAERWNGKGAEWHCLAASRLLSSRHKDVRKYVVERGLNLESVKMRMHLSASAIRNLQRIQFDSYNARMLLGSPFTPKTKRDNVARLPCQQPKTVHACGEPNNQWDSLQSFLVFAFGVPVNPSTSSEVARVCIGRDSAVTLMLSTLHPKGQHRTGTYTESRTRSRWTTVEGNGKGHPT